MKLSKKQWDLLSTSVLFTYSQTKSKAMRRLFRHFGGRDDLADTGVDPVDGPPRHAIIHALRALVVAVNRLDNKQLTDDALKVLTEAEDVLGQCDHGAPAA